MLERIDNWIFKNKLKKLKKNTIRIAIVGNVSSGKSFLMVDMVKVLQDLDIIKSGRILDFKPIDHGRGPSGKTEIYLVRKDNEDFYEAVLKGDKKIQILDMPGEAFHDDTKRLFVELLTALMQCGSIFTKVKYTKKDECKYILKYNHHIETVVDEEVSDLSPEYYHTVDEIIEYYIKKGYKNDRSKRVTGRNVVLNFLEYDTDSVMYAITEAWDDLGLSQRKLQEFRSKQKDMFFWFYTLLSTDIIFCYMLASQKGSVDNSGVPFVNLYNIKGAQTYNIESKSNYYLVYRGVDMMIDETNLKRTKENINTSDYIQDCLNQDYAKACNREHDFVYSVFASEMFSFIIGGNEIGRGIIKSEGFLFNNNGKFEKSDQSAMCSCLRNQIIAPGGFSSNVINQRIGLNAQPYPSFVFFTASGIDDEYSVHKNRQQNISEFEDCGPVGINSGNINRRLCFGTRQLLLSMLYRNGLLYEDYGTNPPEAIKNLWKMMTGIPFVD